MSISLSRSSNTRIPSFDLDNKDNPDYPAYLLSVIRKHNPRPMCALMIGPQAAGKSTFRNSYLNLHPDTDVFSTDDMIEDWAKANGMTYTEAFSKVNFKSMEKQMFESFSTSVAMNKDVLVDRTNVTEGSRARWLNRLPKENWLRVGLIFWASDDVLKERLERRGRETGKYIDWKIVKDTMERYQPPSCNKEFDLIIEIRS